jgi:hypothetical protein
MTETYRFGGNRTEEKLKRLKKWSDAEVADLGSKSENVRLV